jgi:hypothetical protein
VKRRHRGSILFCCVLVAISASAVETRALVSNVATRSSRIPSGPILVKRAILSAPDSDPVQGLLLLFDSWNSDESLRVLASFSNYYLGEAFGGLYDCLVLRKGKAIRPYLEQALRSNSDECKKEFGETRPSLCRSSERKERIGDILRRLDAGERCPDDELAGTWGY